MSSHVHGLGQLFASVSVGVGLLVAAPTNGVGEVDGARVVVGVSVAVEGIAVGVDERVGSAGC